MPSKKCEHGKRSNVCKDCKGVGLCEHGRVRYQCTKCKGASICEHDRRRSRCKECGGSQICEHDRRRSRCKECGGSDICEHGRLRSSCSRCKPEVVYKMYQRDAKRKGRSFELSLDDFKRIVDSQCMFCRESYEPMSCDRVDSSKGYSFMNCQPLCDRCNRMKLDWLDEEFEQHIIKIFQHRPELADRAGFVRIENKA